MSSNGVLDIITYLITFNSAGKILNLSDAEIIAFNVRLEKQIQLKGKKNVFYILSKSIKSIDKYFLKYYVLNTFKFFNNKQGKE